MIEMPGIEEEEEKGVIMVFDLTDEQMSQMEEAIVKLGGRVTNKPTCFDPLVTHSPDYS